MNGMNINQRSENTFSIKLKVLWFEHLLQKRLYDRAMTSLCRRVALIMQYMGRINQENAQQGGMS